MGWNIDIKNNFLKIKKYFNIFLNKKIKNSRPAGKEMQVQEEKAIPNPNKLPQSSWLLVLAYRHGQTRVIQN